MVTVFFLPVKMKNSAQRPQALEIPMHATISPEPTRLRYTALYGIPRPNRR
jgi:hypothetical protein